MALHEQTRRHGFHLPSLPVSAGRPNGAPATARHASDATAPDAAAPRENTPETAAKETAPSTAAAATARSAAGHRSPTVDRSLAVLRIATGFVFLWAFLDKMFGWHYATAGGKGWIDGGSPTKGFLAGVDAGPLQSFFHHIAGAGWADALFMLGMLGIGAALVSGVALRITAVAGTAMMALMWAAEWPPAQHLSTGAPSASANPLVDYHVLYALAMIVFAVSLAGDTWGLGRLWARVPLVGRSPWLR
jgi:thiosulfate dehydrogenase [quinone] large subunit